jgi:hypothetical protein
VREQRGHVRLPLCEREQHARRTPLHVAVPQRVECVGAWWEARRVAAARVPRALLDLRDAALQRRGERVVCAQERVGRLVRWEGGVGCRCERVGAEVRVERGEALRMRQKGGAEEEADGRR